MKRIATGLLLLVFAVAGRAEEEPATKPITLEQAAEAVIEAFEAEDVTALEALAMSDLPDPWLVADELCFRGEHDIADAFAKAAPRKAVEKLPAYVASRRGALPEAAEREFFARLDAAMASGNYASALEGMEAPGPELHSVYRLRVAHAYAMICLDTERRGEGERLLETAAEAALELGWLSRAWSLLGLRGRIAWNREDLRKAASAWSRALDVAESSERKGLIAQTLWDLGYLHQVRGAHDRALAHYERALGLWEEVGDRAKPGLVLNEMGIIHHTNGNTTLARSHFERALEVSRSGGSQLGIGRAHIGLGVVLVALGDYPTAISHYERALTVMAEIGYREAIATTLGNLGNAYQALADYPRALSRHERSLAMEEEDGNRRGQARTLGNIGIVYAALGDHAKAMSFYRRALALAEEVGDRRLIADAYGNMGLVHLNIGDYARALSASENALSITKDLGYRQGIAHAHGNIGLVYQALGDYAKALALFERSLAIKEELGDRAGIARTLGAIGVNYLHLGDYEEARTFHRRSLALKEVLGDRAGVASSLVNLGIASLNRGDPSAALELYERALGLREELRDRHGVANVLINIGAAHIAAGHHAAAVPYLRRGLAAARRLRTRDLQVRVASALAGSHLRLGEPARALMVAREGLQALEGLLGGLADEDGTRLRGQHSSLFAVGTLAAMRLGETGDALRFMESGRAGSLLETLGGGRASSYARLPEALQKLEAEAKAREARARYDHRRALDGGDRKAIRKAARSVDEAMEVRREVTARIQREAKRVAGVFYPRAAPLEEIQGWLEQGEALVLYALCLDETLAFVLTSEDERVVPLGAVKTVEAACADARLAAVSAAVRGPLEAEGAEATPDADARLAALRALLVDPLALDEAVKTVLVSPEGALCYVPFGALFDRSVAVTPSGTTHVLLKEEDRAKGERVLALGDPEYGSKADPVAVGVYRRGSKLTPLPKTREEAAAVGDVVLLGSDANENDLRAAIAKQRRWRAVHLACHGLVNAERPTLSSLALTATDEEDGFLTALEVSRMEIPADLAVLSACETAKGKVVKGEGIVGLTRAFMYAGAPRVLCSLWKVDDDATRALMEKFYELWNPKEGEGLAAAEALREAQAFVRGHEKWAHPYYWAAWVLWGLP